MERQWHLVFTLGKCKCGVSGPASDWVKVCLQAAPSELGLQKLKRSGN